MKHTKEGIDDGKEEYTGVNTHEAIEKEFTIRVKLAARILADKLEDRESNLGMNESYRLALEEMSELICPTHNNLKK